MRKRTYLVIVLPQKTCEHIASKDVHAPILKNGMPKIMKQKITCNLGARNTYIIRNYYLIMNTNILILG